MNVNKVLNFSKFDSGVTAFNIYFYLINHLNYSLIDKKRIERIIINLFNYDMLSVELNLMNAKNPQRFQFDPKKHYRTKITFHHFQHKS
jgi:hypothetical protein